MAPKNKRVQRHSGPAHEVQKTMVHVAHQSILVIQRHTGICTLCKTIAERKANKQKGFSQEHYTWESLEIEVVVSSTLRSSRRSTIGSKRKMLYLARKEKDMIAMLDSDLSAKVEYKS